MEAGSNGNFGFVIGVRASGMPLSFDTMGRIWW